MGPLRCPLQAPSLLREQSLAICRPVAELGRWGFCPPLPPFQGPGALFWQVLRNRGIYENVKYVQQENFWIGPSSVSASPFSSFFYVWALFLAKGLSGCFPGALTETAASHFRKLSSIWVQSSPLA